MRGYGKTDYSVIIATKTPHQRSSHCLLLAIILSRQYHPFKFIKYLNDLVCSIESKHYLINTLDWL